MLNVSSVRTTRFGLKGLQIVGAKLWENIPNNIKYIKDKNILMSALRNMVDTYEH